MGFFDVLDILGTIAFAISGALMAIKREMDVFGIFIVAFVTALGGGILRDVFIGNTPVWWMGHFYVVHFVSISVFLAIVFRNKIYFLVKSLFIFDTIGLAIFTISGVQIGVSANLDPAVSVVLGIMTGCFGGVIRDILCNEIPIIFRKEIYALASLAGGICFIILYSLNFDKNISYISTILLVVVIRVFAVRFGIGLPTYSIKKSKN
ncbi:trimeric intracellular cation channel family protein [Aggregatimonas sangjinii]|uniref:Trimeric intracellular cation channel family protein n=1 Tax=Aggregatimonas sangjinii TaxID=2583587 RepID=A0A5B7STG7_9FLAO|nr:trimeric intracellular cation channel family protein [Aggregatimonas sangjinii]QCX00629.1 trimeric intracellular cation channel family protein [Aggregatimonas sangjinii]